MAPAPRNNHTKDEAGLQSDHKGNRDRGRRYFNVADTIREHKSLLPEDHAPNLLSSASPRSARTVDEDAGLNSAELSLAHDLHHRRGRRHICHGGNFGFGRYVSKTPPTPSLASESFSEESAEVHLGHRQHVCWSALQEVDVVEHDEPTGGASSHHLARRKGRLGFGKKHFGDDCSWTHGHRSKRIDDPGGEDAFYHDGKFTSFLGPAKRHHGKSFAGDHVFDDFVDPKEMHSKKHFGFDGPVHGTEDVPLGSSRQTDLHSSGFLGKSKRYFDGAIHNSSDPISHRSADPVDAEDLTAYGLNHRGKRKFLVQNNLEAGCRHNMSRAEFTKSMPTLRTLRDLPPNETPFYQDDLPAEDMAQKELLPNGSNPKPRQQKTDLDSTWSNLVWTPRAVDQASARAFVEGESPMSPMKSPMRGPQTDEEHMEMEFRATLGATKRSFGNAHNRSDLRLDYADSPTWKSDHITDNGLRWGHGHGRRKFYVGDHLDKDADGVECYVSSNGAVLGKVKHKRVEDHLDASSPSPATTVIFLDPDGRSISTKPRNHVPVRDDVSKCMDDDLQSEDSGTLGVSGVRRRTEVIRAKSARRFPDRDTGRATPRSATPRLGRAGSEASLPVSGRPKWRV